MIPGERVCRSQEGARVYAQNHNAAVRNFLTTTKTMDIARVGQVMLCLNDVVVCDNALWTRFGACPDLRRRRLQDRVVECLDNSVLIVSQDVRRLSVEPRLVRAGSEFSALVMVDLSRKHARIQLFGASREAHKYKASCTQDVRLEKHVRGSHVIFDQERSCFLEDNIPRACYTNMTRHLDLFRLPNCTIREIVMLDRSELDLTTLSRLEHITVRDEAVLHARLDAFGTACPLEIVATDSACLDLQDSELESVILRLDGSASCKGLVVRRSLEVHALSADASHNVKLSDLNARFAINLAPTVANELGANALSWDAAIGNFAVEWTDDVLRVMHETDVPTNTTPYTLERTRQFCELATLLRFEHEPRASSAAPPVSLAQGELMLAPSADFQSVVSLTEPPAQRETVFHANRGEQPQAEPSARAPNVYAQVIARARRDSNIVRVSSAQRQAAGQEDRGRGRGRPSITATEIVTIVADPGDEGGAARTRAVHMFVAQPADRIADVVYTRRLVSRRADYARHRAHSLILCNRTVRPGNSVWERVELANEVQASVLPMGMASRLCTNTFGRIVAHPFTLSPSPDSTAARLLLSFVDGVAVYGVTRNMQLVGLLVRNAEPPGTFRLRRSSSFSDEEDELMQRALLASDAQYRREQEARQTTYSFSESYRLEDMDQEQRAQIENIRPLVPLTTRPADAPPLERDDPRLGNACVVCLDDEAPPDVLPVGCNCKPAKTIVCSDCTPLYSRRWDKCTICNAKLTGLQQL